MKRIKSYILIPVIVSLLSSLLLFTPLDNKFFDLFLRFLPSLTENEKVFVLTLDDDSINLAGGFPFRREVYGDVIILLKELGVNTIAFDLSYLDESAFRFEEEYAADVLDQYLSSGFYRMNQAASAIIDDLSPGASQNEREQAKRNIRAANERIRREIESSVPYLGRDVDEYFAKALAFTGCSWLTLTFISQEDVFAFIDETDDSGETNEFKTDAEIDRYLVNYIAPGNVISKGDTKTPEMVGVFPAINKLLSRAKGAGFVNASPDNDGFRRRVNLLLKYQDEYYGHLTLRGMQEKLGFTSIEVSNKNIILKKDDSEMMRIPRTQDGSVLLKWPKKSFYDYKMMSLVGLIYHTMEESLFVRNMSEMNDWGFFYYFDDFYTPWDYYLTALDIRDEAFANDSMAGSDWIQARHDFFNACEEFLFGPYEDYILDDVGGDPDLLASVQFLFEVSREQFKNLMVERQKAAVLQDSFCVIGSDATSMTDTGLITFQENYPNVGTYAVVANMLLSGEFLNDMHWIIPLIIALLYSLLIGYFISRFETHLSILTGISSLILLSAFFVLFFLITKRYIGFSVPLISTALTFISIMVTKFLTASREKAFLHSAFSRYLAPEVISEIINDPDKLNLGGEKRVMTAIFTDIKGFSTISEKLGDPKKLVKLLNLYLTKLSNIVMENLGTIDKYIGDAIVAFYGAPVFRDNHAVLACRSAIAMKAAEKEINEMIENSSEEDKLSPVPLFTRIGINTGEMVVGNMGAENKMDYTIMGNAVNLTARLEGVNSQYRTGGILLSEYTRQEIGDEFLLRRLDRVRVVGINTPLRLYELLDNFETSTPEERNAVEQWEKALDLYENKQFPQALELFKSLGQSNPNDNVAGLYCERCEAYIKEPPSADWDAVRNLTEK